MSEDRFERRFDRIFKSGMVITMAGGAFMAFVGLPVYAIFDNIKAFYGGLWVALCGGIICLLAFGWDILCNPRWRSK